MHATSYSCYGFTITDIHSSNQSKLILKQYQSHNTDGTKRLTVQDDKVGIGTDSPGYNLDVNGSFNSTSINTGPIVSNTADFKLGVTNDPHRYQIYSTDLTKLDMDHLFQSVH